MFHINHLIKKNNEIFQECLKDKRTNVNYANLQSFKAELTDVKKTFKNYHLKRLGNKLKLPHLKLNGQ